MKQALYLLLAFVIVFCTQTQQVHAQKLSGQQLIDSLLEELPKYADDSNKVKVLSSLGVQYASINQSKGLSYSNEALALARQINWQYGIAKSLLSVGNAYYKKDDFPTALNYFQQSLDICEQERLQNLESRSILVIGNIYAEINEHEKALLFYEKSLKLSRLLKNRPAEANIINNIASVYINMGNYSRALEYYIRSLVMKEEQKDPFAIAMAYNNIGYAYLMLEEYDKSLEYCQKSLKINKEINNNFRAAENTFNIACAYLEKGQYPIAIDYTKQSIKYVDEVGALNKQQENYALLAQLYKKTGNTSAALKAFEWYDVLKDSLTEKRNVQQVSQLRMRSEYEKKQIADSIANAQEKIAAEEKLKRQKVISFSGIAIALVLILLSTFIARERKKSDKLLLNILPAEVAKELKSRGATTAHHFDNVTVLFTDFVNFTKAGERLGSEALVEELHSCFKAFDEIIGKYGIEKIKTIGDAYLAVCGLPTADNEHAAKTVQAAQEIRDFMLQRREQLGDKTFEVRIGIHSGEVVAGIVGVKKFAYDIWGDTVNTAARMESNSEPGRINISQTTYELVQDKFPCTYRGELEAKNKGRLKMYFVES